MIYKFINTIIIKLIIYFIKFYQLLISPILPSNCRYLPSCSEYTIASLREHGLIVGTYYACRRIFSCHPLGKHGFDPVPKKIKKET